jgi:hypothetical protein
VLESVAEGAEARGSIDRGSGRFSRGMLCHLGSWWRQSVEKGATGRLSRGMLCHLGSWWRQSVEKGATAREHIVVGVIGSSVAFCIEYLVATATVAPEG